MKYILLALLISSIACSEVPELPDCLENKCGEIVFINKTDDIIKVDIQVDNTIYLGEYTVDSGGTFIYYLVPAGNITLCSAQPYRNWIYQSDSITACETKVYSLRTNK